MSPKQALAFVKKHGVVLQATASGAHRARRTAFPGWVPADVARQGERLSPSRAEALLSPLLASGGKQTRARRAPAR